MGRYLRLEDIKLRPRVETPKPIKSLKYYCAMCERYHWIYSNIGNEHRGYKT